MSYENVQPPFSLKFREMPKKELKGYYDWFQQVMPQRLDELARAVKSTPDFATWQPDLSPASLDLLGDWFAYQVETRPRTQREMIEIESHSAYPISAPEEELTNKTFSLAMDVGMYLSQVFLKGHPSLRWDQPFGDKKFVDYGQPVLAGFGAAPFNPVRMMVTFAYGVASKKESGRGLSEIYLIWSRLIRP